jgi:hypothetical protein
MRFLSESYVRIPMFEHRYYEGIKEGPYVVGINTRIKDHEIKLLQHARRTEGKSFPTLLSDYKPRCRGRPCERGGEDNT